MTGGADVLTSCHAIGDPATPPHANVRRRPVEDQQLSV